MMKIKISKGAKVVKGILPFVALVFMFLLSGVQAHAQQLATSSSSTLVKQYGEDFLDVNDAVIAVKQSHEATSQTPANTPVEEIAKALDLHFSATLVEALGNSSSIKSALNEAYQATILKTSDFVGNTTDVEAINEKYYDLLTK